MNALQQPQACERNGLSWPSTWPFLTLRGFNFLGWTSFCESLCLMYWGQSNISSLFPMTPKKLWANSRGHVGKCFSESLTSHPLSTLHLRKIPTEKHLLETNKKVFSMLTLGCYWCLFVLEKCERNDSWRRDLTLFKGIVIGKVKVRTSEFGKSVVVPGNHFA